MEALDIAQRITTRLAAEHRTPADLKTIAKRQREFEGSLKRGNHLDMSEANKNFHMAIADAGRNPYLAGFYERLLTQGRRMLHMHFDYLKKPAHGYLLTDEHDDMLAAIEEKNVERADKLAHAHTRQFRDHFIDFMKDNYVTNVSLATTHENRLKRPHAESCAVTMPPGFGTRISGEWPLSAAPRSLSRHGTCPRY